MKTLSKKFVFRVANGKNQGPFRSNGNSKRFHDWGKFCDSDMYPNYADDGLGRFGESAYITALPNACALFHWFGEDLDKLVCAKFKVFRIEVKDLRVGFSGVQAVYHRKADKIGKMSIVPIQYKGLLL